MDGSGHLFVSNEGTGTIGEYTTSGGTVNSALISGLDNPAGIALDGKGNLYVANYGNIPGQGFIGEYTTSGNVVSNSLVSDLDRPVGLAIGPDGNLYEVNAGANTVGEYTTTGVPVNPAFITGLDDPQNLVFASGSDGDPPVPETPSFLVSAGLMIPLIIFVYLRKRAQVVPVRE